MNPKDNKHEGHEKAADHDHGGGRGGLISNWRPSTVPLTVPEGHLGEDDYLEALETAKGRFPGDPIPTAKVDPQTAQEKFDAFVAGVSEKTKAYNAALDDWRKHQAKADEALRRYKEAAHAFNDFIEKTTWVEVSAEDGFMLEVVMVRGFVTDLRIMAHPAKGASSGFSTLYSHSKKCVRIIGDATK